MKIIKATLLAVLLVLTLLALFTNTAYGITGNFQADSTPYTGIVVLFSDTERQQLVGYCTGFLLSPKVMVTAGHCLINVAAVSVCFDKGPIGYAIQDGKIAYYDTNMVYNGVPVSYPEYDPDQSGNREFLTSDIGLITTDQPVSGIEVFPKLPEPGLVDALQVKTDLRVIGYGYQFQTTPKNNDATNLWTGTLSCNIAQIQMQSTHFSGSDKYLKLSANAAQNKGGVAFGDSGGPVIYNTNGDSQDIVLAVNAYVSNSNCAGVTYHTRIDSPEVLCWIKGYLPSSIEPASDEK